MRDDQKTAIVTGGSRGIGRAIAVTLAEDGYRVVVSYAGDAAAADETLAAIDRAGGEAIALQGDVSKSADVVALFDGAERHFGKVSVLVNNAGRAVRKPLADFTEVDYDNVMGTNLKGVFLTLSEAARRLLDGGRIVNISASFQGAPIPGYAVYAASKMAIEKMTEVAAKELGARGITVNAVRPGPTNTDLFKAGKNAEVVSHFAQAAALGRVGEPQDIANVIAFLVSSDGGWVTGQSIGANGGYW